MTSKTPERVLEAFNELEEELKEEKKKFAALKKLADQLLLTLDHVGLTERQVTNQFMHCRNNNGIDFEKWYRANE